ncbi:DUF4097 family beta strand repeat-containing protein [Agromyces sp. Marseille-Q5079]|uniref:DUF4097 family beta strand repeat-containing protein n=1 Tax=Agromyces sp. Marseille-Q5079 TaxID=3439059 RepID=UPI003D9CA059
MLQKFTTTAPITAVLNISAGRVQVIAADRTDTTVEVRPANASKGRDVKAAERTTVEFHDGVVRVVTPAGNQLVGPSGMIEVTVQVPTGSRVEGTAAAAEFRGVGRLGDVAFDGAYGTIKIDEADSVRLTALAGDVSVGRLNGAAQITTSKGDISIAEAVQGTVVLRTQAGDVSIGAVAEASATLDAGTSFGRIQNALKNAKGAGAELSIEATTLYGDIDARSL